MSLSIIVDMSLSPVWVDFLSAKGWKSLHWSAVGDPRAKDDEIMTWCSSNGHAAFTRDLDFSRALALAHSHGPRVIQVRGEDVLPQTIGAQVETAIRSFESELIAGALLTIEKSRVRLRTLPFNSGTP